jgi:RimJ/RimL family protein N-acetyltransferase
VRLDDLSEDDARAIARWRYPAPYDCYDSPAWEQMEREGWALCDDETRRTEFRALRAGVRRPTGHGDELAGYARFRPAGDALALHVGLRPDLCGQGVGQAFLDLVLDEARRRAGGLPVTLQVRRFNARAIAAYRRAGFRRVDAGGDDPSVTGDPQQRLAMVLATPTP